MNKLSTHLQIKLCEAILENNLQDASQILFDSAVECWSLVISEPEDYKNVGNCRIGGDPDLPPSIAWPQTADGLYLNFIMQINLEELPPMINNQLPGHGMLYFFVESDESCTHVLSKLLYYDGDAALLSRVESPSYEMLCHEYYVDLEAHKITPITSIDLPELGSEVFNMIESVTRTTNFGAPAEKYCKLMESISGVDKGIYIVGKLMGHISEIDGDLRWNACLNKAGQHDLIYNYHKPIDEIECLLKQALEEHEVLEIEYYRKVKASFAWYQQHEEHIKRSHHEWLPLLKIDSNRSVDLSIWDSGSFNILIRQSDLRKLDFSDVYVEIATQ